MKRAGTLLAFLFFGLAAAGTTKADSISSFQFFFDFEDFGSGDRSWTRVEDNEPGKQFNFSYGHEITFDPLACDIVWAKLLIRYKYVSGSGERWAVYGDADGSPGGEVKLGTLPATSDWKIAYFWLPSTLFPGLPASDWNLTIRFLEKTPGNEDFKLDWSKVVGKSRSCCTPVPEASPLTLALIGLAGLAVLVGKGRG